MSSPHSHSQFTVQFGTSCCLVGVASGLRTEGCSRSHSNGEEKVPRSDFEYFNMKGTRRVLLYDFYHHLSTKVENVKYSFKGILNTLLCHVVTLATEENVLKKCKSQY